MFVQLFRMPVSDPAVVHQLTREWMRDHAPRAAAEGWLSTTGVVSDGEVLGFGIFDSPEAARRNGDRPGQNEWWTRLAAHFTGPVIFRNCTGVEVGRAGADPRSGFVRVVEGRTSDRARLRRTAAGFDEAMTDALPGLIGFVLALHDEEPGVFTQMWYFADEQAARAAELDALTDDAARWMRQMRDLTEELRRVETHEPWLDPAPSHALGESPAGVG